MRERAITWLKRNGYPVTGALAIGGRRCLGCLVRYLSPFGHFELLLWRDDDVAGEFALADYFAHFPDVQPPQPKTGDRFTLAHQGTDTRPLQVVLVAHDGSVIGRITRSNEQRLARELSLGITWYATVTDRVQRQKKDPKVWVRAILEDNGIIPAQSTLRYITEKTSRTSKLNLSFAERWLVYERDCFTCIYCGKRPQWAGDRLVIDHIVPRSEGGGDELTNLGACCLPCNAGKGSRMIGAALLQELQEVIRLRTEHILQDEERQCELRSEQRLERWRNENW